jgi:hypothetical protein
MVQELTMAYQTKDVEILQRDPKELDEKDKETLDPKGSSKK